MTCRIEDGVWFNQVYNSENRIQAIQKLTQETCPEPNELATADISIQWDFMYDGNGVRTTTFTTMYEDNLPVESSWTAYFFGGAYEIRSDNTIIKYYSFAGQTIMNDGSGLQYFLTDHLGSMVAVTDENGDLVSQQRYLPFGGVRSDVNDITQTDYGYTGQRNLDNEIGLMDYKARFYSPVLSRFIQPDSIVPNPVNPQAYNRFSYVVNNPINLIDPSGHCYLNSSIWIPNGQDGACSWSLSSNDKGSDKGDNGCTGCSKADESDPEILTKEGESFCKTSKQCYSGEGMQDLFNYYTQTPGWWNNNGSSDFTIVKFLGMMLMYEMGQAVGAEPWIIQASILQLWGDSSAYGGHVPYCSNTCKNGVFNFLAAYVQSAHKRYDLIIRQIDPTNGSPKTNYDPNIDPPYWAGPGPYSPDSYPEYFSSQSANIGNQILNPNPADMIYTNDRPYHWGNYTKAGNLQPFYNYGSFYVFSVNQQNAANAAGGSLIPVP